MNLQYWLKISGEVWKGTSASCDVGQHLWNMSLIYSTLKFEIQVTFVVIMDDLVKYIYICLNCLWFSNVCFTIWDWRSSHRHIFPCVNIQQSNSHAEWHMWHRLNITQLQNHRHAWSWVQQTWKVVAMWHASCGLYISTFITQMWQPQDTNDLASLCHTWSHLQ